MRPAARDAFWRFSVEHEGYVEHPYLDVVGLVTVGVGFLCDPLSLALPLPWVWRSNGRPATRAEVTVEWMRIKGMACGVYGPDARVCAWAGTGQTCLAHQGHRAAAKVATLRLTESSVRWLVDAKLTENVIALRKRWPEWDTFPADAQLALAGWAWAVGPHARWPMLDAAVRAQVWGIAAIEIRIRETGNPGVIARNVAQRQALLNAHRVVRDGLDPAQLYWPSLIDPPPTLRDVRQDHAASRPTIAAPGPVLEDDGGASRREATAWTLRGQEPPDGDG